MQRPELKPLASAPTTLSIAEGIPELMVMGYLNEGEKFVISGPTGDTHRARLLAHAAVEVDGVLYVNLRRALKALRPTGSLSPISGDCTFERDGRRVRLSDIRSEALKDARLGVSREEGRSLDRDSALPSRDSPRGHDR
jgi:hypothetical protein